MAFRNAKNKESRLSQKRIYACMRCYNIAKEDLKDGTNPLDVIQSMIQEDMTEVNFAFRCVVFFTCRDMYRTDTFDSGGAGQLQTNAQDLRAAHTAHQPLQKLSRSAVFKSGPGRVLCQADCVQLFVQANERRQLCQNAQWRRSADGSAASTRFEAK